MSTRWHRKATLKMKVRGEIVNRVFIRRRVRVSRPCTKCGDTLVAGSLFWRHDHRSYHIECFEELQRGIEQAHIKGAGGRKPVLDADKMRAIDNVITTARARGGDPDYRAIAHTLQVSERTVRRYVKGNYKAVEGRELKGRVVSPT